MEGLSHLLLLLHLLFLRHNVLLDGCKVFGSRLYSFEVELRLLRALLFEEVVFMTSYQVPERAYTLTSHVVTDEFTHE